MIHLWCGVSHENIHKLLGFTVDYEGSVSLIQPWSETQNALQYVKGGRDPRPLVRRSGQYPEMGSKFLLPSS